MRVAVVGSRERGLPEDRIAVHDLIDTLPEGDIVVSGGCRGIDSWAVEFAKSRGMETMEFEPIMLYKYPSYPQLVKAYYARNRLIVDNCDVVYAFPSIKGLKGGTRNTVEYAVKQGKPVMLK